jgi:hypothetical protein
MTMTTTITDTQIEQLRDEATAAGDHAQVAICDAALGVEPTRFAVIAQSSGLLVGLGTTADLALRDASLETLQDCPDVMAGYVVQHAIEGETLVAVYGGGIVTAQEVPLLSQAEARAACARVIHEAQQ